MICREKRGCVTASDSQAAAVFICSTSIAILIERTFKRRDLGGHGGVRNGVRRFVTLSAHAKHTFCAFANEDEGFNKKGVGTAPSTINEIEWLIQKDDGRILTEHAAAYMLRKRTSFRDLWAKFWLKLA